jgi:hypothetical protein
METNQPQHSSENAPIPSPLRQLSIKRSFSESKRWFGTSIPLPPQALPPLHLHSVTWTLTSSMLSCSFTIDLYSKNAAAESENPLIASSTNHPERSALAEPSSSRARKEPSPDPNVNREKVKLMVWTKFHFPLSASNANAARIFEKKRQITVFRVSSPSFPLT